MDGDFIVRSLEAIDAVAALDLDADGERVSGEDALECSIALPSWVSAGPGSRYVHRDESMLPWSNWMPAKWPAGPRCAAPACRPGSAGRAHPRDAIAARNLFQKPAPVEGFDAWAPESSHSKREPLQG